MHLYFANKTICDITLRLKEGSWLFFQEKLKNTSKQFHSIGNSNLVDSHVMRIVNSRTTNLQRKALLSPTLINWFVADLLFGCLCGFKDKPGLWFGDSGVCEWPDLINSSKQIKAILKCNTCMSSQLAFQKPGTGDVKPAVNILCLSTVKILLWLKGDHISYLKPRIYC